MNTTTTTNKALGRRLSIKGLFELRQSGDKWMAIYKWSSGKHAVIEGTRAEVVSAARARWGHFNFQDEAEAFAEIFH